jgi:hypothetical protein
VEGQDELRGPEAGLRITVKKRSWWATMLAHTSVS